MAKKRSKKFSEKERNKKRQQQDAELSIGLANFTDAVHDDLLEDDGDRSDSDWEDTEQHYELLPRKLENQETKQELLPIKRDGIVERVVKRVEAKDDSSEEESSSDENEGSTIAKSDDTAGYEDHSDSEEAFSEENVLQLKEEIAELVEKLTEQPEENIACLTRLMKMANSKNPNTARFTLLALVPSFKSIVPGYRIRALTDAEKRERVSKDVQKIRNFEQTLVLNYKAYVDLLTNLTSNSKNDAEMSVFAIKAASELAASLKNFNYRPDLLVLLIRRICKPSFKNDPMFSSCVKTLEELLADDDSGDISFDVVRLLSKTLRSRKFKVDESVLNIFLSLSILDDFDPNATEEERLTKQKLRKKDRVHLSKKERKARKERKQIEEEMRVAEQAISAEQRERYQGEILKMLLKVYLDILREGNEGLFGAAFEGLSRIGHLVNFDLLGDFLEVIREVISNTDINEIAADGKILRQLLLSIVTAFALVSSHSQYKVQVDLSKFIDALYASLYPLSFDADIEFSYKTLRLSDPLSNEISKPSVNVSTKIELLLRALESIFFKSKNGSTERALAFSKKMITMLLHTPEKSSIALTKFIQKLMARYAEIGAIFSTEDRVANGKYDIDALIPSRSNAKAATVWELFILEKHYSPEVSAGVKHLFLQAKEETK